MISTSRIVIALSALPLAFANYPLMNGTTTSVVYPTGTSSPSPATQTVSVGKNGLVFSPDTVHAKTGDEIVFEFYPKNHAVVQADFNNPCNPSIDEKRIFSDFIPSAVGRAVCLLYQTYRKTNLTISRTRHLRSRSKTTKRQSGSTVPRTTRSRTACKEWLWSLIHHNTHIIPSKRSE